MFLWQQLAIKTGTPIDPMKFPLFGTVATDYTNPQFIISDSYHYTTGFGWKAFDADPLTYWYTYQQYATATLTVECVVPKVLRAVRVHNNMGSEPAATYRPGTIRVEVRNSTSESWTTMGTYTFTWNVTNTNINYTNSLPIPNNTAYKYYRFLFTRAAGAAYVALTTLMLSESPQIDFLPTT